MQPIPPIYIRKKWQILAFFTLLPLIAACIFLLPPASLVIIAVLILLVTAAIFTLCSIFLQLRRSLLIAAGVAIFLVINVFIGFEIINTILLVSFIIGLDRLLS
jgi:hypothetical protein